MAISQETYNHATKMWLYMVAGVALILLAESLGILWITTINSSPSYPLNAKMEQAQNIAINLRFIGCLVFAVGLSEKIIFEMKLMHESK